jgi:hypothetical protein
MIWNRKKSSYDMEQKIVLKQKNKEQNDTGQNNTPVR